MRYSVWQAVQNVLALSCGKKIEKEIKILEESLRHQI